MTFSKAKGRKPALFFFDHQFPASSDFELLRYYVEDCKFMMDNLAVSAKLTSALFILFSVVDYFIYPEFFKLFLGLRITCISVLTGIIVVSKGRWAKRRYRAFASLIPLTSALFLAIMIYLLRAPDSIYYAGLSLCLVGTGTLYQWSSKDAAITSIIIFLLFLIPNLIHLNEFSADTAEVFGANCIFMISTGILVVIGTYYHYSFRCQEFVARTTLRKQQADLVRLKNEKLKQTKATLRDTETQLFQSEKMSLLGQLSAGVIHEVANPLNFTNQALDILRTRVKRSKTETQIEFIIEDMQEGLDRIRDTITDLREFAHIGKKGRERILVHDTISSSLRFLNKQIIEENVEVEIDVDETFEIEAVRNQMVQVLINLIHNALQAMNGTENQSVLKIKAEKSSDNFLSIFVTDNGPGIASENLDQIFDPFFSTKDPGEGTGLGLSICFRIIENHSGTIEPFSKIGEGTAFCIRIPVEQPVEKNSN